MELLDSVADLREVQKLEGHADRVWSLAWNPAPHNCGGASAMLASCSGDKTVKIWQMGPTRQWECSGHENEVKSVSWSSSGMEKNFWVAVLQGHSQDVKMAQWHPLVDVLVSASYENKLL
ncbi:putative cytosolic iron-sulfur protein assembly protein CIAO1 [Carex littledalei]|uniref:Putative cytosolic iron-sulfur protein assembly protein CIAO1 n=1 Tax=Carex littledalei TaxID=544730 RepID=A0A833RIE6_9POAL|nr:putative cytosolic iron-sulfur protein assembly protein CIAO1 [Carex littledalei]